jgi:hypothetical protein
MNVTNRDDLRLLADALEVSMGGRDPDGNYLFCQNPERRKRGEELRAELRAEFLSAEPKRGRPKAEVDLNMIDGVLFRYHMTDLCMSEIAIGLGMSTAAVNRIVTEHGKGWRERNAAMLSEYKERKKSGG